MSGMPATADLSNWQGAARPSRVVLEGRWARLEPLQARHGAALLDSARQPGAEDRFRYLYETPPDDDPASFQAWLDQACASADPMFWAVIDRATGRAEGRQSLMRIDPAHGVIEVGHILWGPAIGRSRIATEALLLFARHVFQDLGYRRFEWKCNALNAPSRRAAARFGFTEEGVFRQHMVIKGQSRDTAWCAMIDADWPRLRAGYDRWLAPENFDHAGQQLSRLTVA
jgi:RimJ/RimL family protein N-acetyltransferase